MENGFLSEVEYWFYAILYYGVGFGVFLLLVLFVGKALSDERNPPVERAREWLLEFNSKNEESSL